MAINDLSYPICNNSDRFDTDLSVGATSNNTGKAERKQRVLAFLVDAQLALPRLALWRNLAYNGADFTDSALKNYLRELREEGVIERIDAEQFAERTVQPSDDDPGYWVATSEGAERIERLREDQRSGIDTGHL